MKFQPRQNSLNTTEIYVFFDVRTSAPLSDYTSPVEIIFWNDFFGLRSRHQPWHQENHLPGKVIHYISGRISIVHALSDPTAMRGVGRRIEYFHIFDRTAAVWKDDWLRVSACSRIRNHLSIGVDALDSWCHGRVRKIAELIMAEHPVIPSLNEMLNVLKQRRLSLMSQLAGSALNTSLRRDPTPQCRSAQRCDLRRQDHAVSTGAWCRGKLHINRPAVGAERSGRAIR